MNNRIKKAFSHKLDVFGKSVPTFAIAFILIAGFGTAATVTYFTQTTGTMDVDQSITGDLSSITYENPTAPYTDYNEFTVTNNNQERSVSFNWEVISQGNFGDDSAFRELYSVQNFDLYHAYSENNQWNLGDTTGNTVEVVPNVDQVTYRIPIQTETEWANLEVTRKNGDNYHVAYDANGDSFSVNDASTSGNNLDPSNVADVISTSATSSEVEVVLDKEISYDQTFAVHLGNSSGDYSMTENFFSSTGGTYSDSGSSAHQSIDFTNHLGTQEDFSPSEVREYNLGVFFDTDTQNKEYTVDVGASPVTIR